MSGGYRHFVLGPRAGLSTLLLAAWLACAGCQTPWTAGHAPSDPAQAKSLAELADEQRAPSTPAGKPAGTVSADHAGQNNRYPVKTTQFNSAADKSGLNGGAVLPPNPSGPENVSLYPYRPKLNSPHEKWMISLPTYVIQPPDVLLIDAVKLVPKSPYRIEALDQLDIKVAGTLPDQPITSTYAVEPSGAVNLGPTYGRVLIQGLTLEEATHAVDQHLRRLLKEPEVSITLVASAGQQQITGEHLVGPDGTVNLGIYGNVYVTGLTIEQAQAVLQKHLSRFLEGPKVSVDVFAYNSLVYYVISDGAGNGDTVSRYPITGNETVLDALAQVNGLTRANSKRIWIARPAHDGMECDQILHVNYQEIVRGGSTATNYQLLPGDRLFLEGDHWIAADSFLGKIIAPFERVFGFTLLGSQTVQNLQTFPGGPSGGR